MYHSCNSSTLSATIAANLQADFCAVCKLSTTKLASVLGSDSRYGHFSKKCLTIGSPGSGTGTKIA